MRKLNNLELIKLTMGLDSTGPKKYFRDSVLFYEGHVPHACYLLCEGEIVLTKRKKVKLVVSPKHIVGFLNFQQQTESAFTAHVKAGSVLYIIDKSTFVELKDCQDDELKSIVS